MSGQAINKNNPNKRHLRNPLSQATFLVSSPDMSHVPADDAFEVVFAGRSNSGKSSALNALCDQKSLARTSKTPGRTQHLVFFALDDSHRLVDLPGYGYAKVSANMRRRWQETLDEYLSTRKSLKGMVLMMDSRHPLKEFDQQLLEWCDYQGLPVLVLLTKADKLKNGPAKNTLLQVKKDLSDLPRVTVQLFSALKHTGVELARRHILDWLELRPAQKKP